MAIDNAFTAWEKLGHIQTFDYTVFYPKAILIRRLESYNEIKILNGLKKDRKEAFSLLDIGCATGEFYRYFKAKYPNLQYYGCDVSQKAVGRAKEKFPQGNFFTVDEALTQLKDGGIYPEIIFCRDTIIHQTDPFLFLRRLCNIPSKYIILRLRTRDVGNTVLDPEVSCQLYYETWTPYMILNSDEIVSFLKESCPGISRVIFYKHYMVLGGLVNRYLPKDTYFQHTKTAETAMLIEKEPAGKGYLKVEVMENDEKVSYLTIILVRIFSLMVRFISGRNYTGKVWW